MTDYLQRYIGPYGTNVGDIWSGEDSEIGRRLLKEHGCILIHEVFANEETGKPEEKIYNVKLDNPDMGMQGLIRQAREGTKLWIEAQAKRN